MTTIGIRSNDATNIPTSPALINRAAQAQPALATTPRLCPDGMCNTRVAHPGLTTRAPLFGDQTPPSAVPLSQFLSGKVGGDKGALLQPTRSYTRGDIFSGFHQGYTGNCTQVGAIKAGMMRFGAGNIFQSTKRSGDGYDVTMRDGFKLHLSRQELDLARAHCQFQGRDPYLVQQATLAYAGASKRAQMQGNDGWAPNQMTYQQAMKTINDGEALREGAHWLGLSRHVKNIHPSEMHRYPFAVGASNPHVVFTASGLTDCYGKAQRFNGTDTWGNRLHSAYTLS